MTQPPAKRRHRWVTRQDYAVAYGWCDKCGWYRRPYPIGAFHPRYWEYSRDGRLFGPKLSLVLACEAKP